MADFLTNRAMAHPLCQFHRQMCHTFFDQIERGERVYIHFESLEESLQSFREPTDPESNCERDDQNTVYAEITVLSYSMVEYDLAYLGSENFNQNAEISQYHPYFSFFLVPITSENVSILGKIQMHMSNERNWFIGKLQSSDFESEFFPYKWMLDGSYITAASPINHLQKKLLIFDDDAISEEERLKINRISKAYDFDFTSAQKTSYEIENILKKAWPTNEIPSTIDIYNVGHGNADYIRSSNGKILFDVGYDYRHVPDETPYNFVRAVRALRRMTPDCVILSHWDLDHIIGCAYAEHSLVDCPWIAPTLLPNASINAKRLARYLQCLNRLCLIDRNQSPQLIASIHCNSNVLFNLWLCSGFDSLISEENRSGLIVELTERHPGSCYPHVVLAGDVPYRCIPPAVFATSIDFLHVPHHCSKMCLSALKRSNSPAGTLAVISTQRRKNPPHEIVRNMDHWQLLHNKFRKVVCTIDHSPVDDSANLSVQINYANSTYLIR